MCAAAIRVILILCVVSRAHFEMQSFQHQMYVTRKSRSNSHPIQTGYVYNRVGKVPGLITTFDYLYEKPTEIDTSVTSNEDRGGGNGIRISNTTERQLLNFTGNENKFGTTLPYSKPNEERVKAESKYLSQKGAEAGHLITVKDYEPTENILKEWFVNYGAQKQFRIDNEDLRTDSRNAYNGWPYSYQGGPYQYQIKDIETITKVKDKRFLGADTSIIPVYRNKEDYGSHNEVRPITKSALYKPVTTDNPIYGNQPFFSFVLNDYFDKNTDEDPISFKDFTWAEDFDNKLSYQDDSRFPNRRSDYNKYPQKRQEGGKYSGKTYDLKNLDSEIVNNKAHDINQKYGKDEKSYQNNGAQTSNHGHRSGFKNFVDFFANKFGSENHNKNSKLMLKQNQDKSEKRKGFHRVYHKDEYQEDKEFYDNTHKKAQAEENGGTSLNVGGSQAILHSNAVAAEGNEANLFTTAGNSVNRIYENNNENKEKPKGDYREINHYKDVAKNAAFSNNADYVD